MKAYTRFLTSLVLVLALPSHGSLQTDTPPNTQEESIPFTPPDKALEMITLPDGFTATLFASEPDVNQPIAVCTDYRGRLWVVECHTYSDSKTNYDMSLNDRVSIFEDTDNDGRFDKKTVFWDEGKKLTGIELGYGGVWLTAAPNFIFIPDRNNDDKPDGPPEILLNGFEDNVIRHNIVNGLRWGPDGWLYGRHGIQATSHVGTPDATESQRIPMNCAIWRFHPTAKKFEVVAEGGTNPWGFDYDENGEMFMINTVIGHLFHVVPGARFRRMYGSHFNRHTYQVIEQTADHFHWDQGEEHWAVTKGEGMSSGTDAAGGGHAHSGLMIYQGGNWPVRYHNTLFTANFHGRRLNNDMIQRKGNSFIARHGKDFMTTKDPWFRGVELISGPDGGVFVLDWSDIGECHENDGIHRTSGRIFKITYENSEDSTKRTELDLNTLSNDEAFIVDSDNSWYARKKLRLIAERQVAGTLDNEIAGIHRLRLSGQLLNNGPAKEVLQMLWAQHAAGLADETILLKATWHENESVRAWAVRLLADGLTPLSQQTVKRLESLARDRSSLVRMYVASSLNRVDGRAALTIAQVLCTHELDARDRVQPSLIWYRIEPAVTKHWEHAIRLARSTRIPIIRQNIIRRLTSEIDTMPHAVQAIANELEDRKIEPANTLRGMSLALDGRISAKPPQNWETVSKQFSEFKDDISKLGIIFGDGRAVNDLKAIATSYNPHLEIRRNAIRSWAATKPDDVEQVLKQLFGDKSLTSQVVRSMVHCESPEIGDVIINRYHQLTPDEKSAAVNTLTARAPWASRLLGAVEKGLIPKQAVTAYHASRIFEFQDEQLTKQLNETWGSFNSTPEEKQKTIGTLTLRLTELKETLSAADLKNGELLFTKNCSTCHILFGKGGSTGPDLTGANRNNLNYLLTNIIAPSSSVAESYRSSIISLNDGRLISGLVLQQDDHVVSVQTTKEVISIAKSEIDEIRLTEKSVMPEGLLNNLEPNEIVDLVGYLMSQ